MYFRYSTCLVSIALFLGCATAPQFAGNSVTDSTLRNDVVRTVRPLFQINNSCNSIDNVQAKVVNLKKTTAGKIVGANELWTVNGCGKSANYDIRLQADAKGETDFSVSLSKTQP